MDRPPPHKQCWEDVKTLPTEEDTQTPVILRSSTDTSYLKDRFFVLVRAWVLRIGVRSFFRPGACVGGIGYWYWLTDTGMVHGASSWCASFGFWCSFARPSVDRSVGRWPA